MAKKLVFTTNNPSANTDYAAADGTWKTMSGGGGGVPTTRTLTINGTAQDLSADRTWTVGDMLQSTYDTDVDGVVDSAERIQIIVRNSTGSTLTKGQIVYLSGATGNRPNAILAQANSEATSSKTIGMVIANIANNADGQIAVNGTLHDIDTSAFTAGDSLWLSATTAGGYVANTPPAEPNHAVFIGYVARAHPTQGRVVLAIQNGYELTELHGVEITSVANNDVLKYNSTTGLWVNGQPTANTSIQSSIIGTTITVQASPITRYHAIAGAVTSSAVGYQVPVPMACTISNFHFRTYGTQPNNGSFVATIQKNAVDTAITITIAAGAAANTFTDTTNSETFAANDTWQIKLIQNGTTGASPTASSVGSYSFKITM